MFAQPAVTIDFADCTTVAGIRNVVDEIADVVTVGIVQLAVVGPPADEAS
jgi:hypothetical protein